MQIRSLYFGSRFLSSPLEAMFTFLIFILSKDLNANPFQLTLLAASKPFVSIFAFYLNAFAAKGIQRFPVYLAILNAIGCIPCLLFPFIGNPWFFIASYMIFMTSMRAAYPIWMEILKSQFGVQKMGGLISKGTSINYGLVIFIPMIASVLMDQNGQIWQWIFVFLGLLQLLNSLLLMQIQMVSTDSKSVEYEPKKIQLLEPLKEAWKICKSNRSFVKYLFMFFLGGAGLVALQPVLPSFFNDVLHLSYLKLAMAISVIKGIAFLITSPFWGRWNKSLYSLNGFVNVLSCLFIACLLASTINVNWIFLGYVFYGSMQAGCELSFNLCGPVFSEEEKSLSYSGLNLALLGIRACIFPALGQMIYIYSNVNAVLVFSGTLCLLSVLCAFYFDRQYFNNLKESPA